MSVVVDDTKDAWPNATNVVQIEPYEFFQQAVEVNNASGGSVGNVAAGHGQRGGRPTGPPVCQEEHTPCLLHVLEVRVAVHVSNVRDCVVARVHLAILRLYCVSSISRAVTTRVYVHKLGRALSHFAH